MTQKHTLLPWVSGHSAHNLQGGKSGTFVRSLELASREICEINKSLPEEVRKANAAFIVRACNSHYESLNMLKSLSGLCMGKIKSDIDILIAKIEGE